MSEQQAPYIVRDAILDRYADLPLMSEIEDMGIYAAEWQLLALECDKLGRIATAETCRKRAQYYCEIAGGRYIRLIEGCFAELIPVDAEPMIIEVTL